MSWPKRRWWLGRWLNNWRMTWAVRRHPQFQAQIAEYQKLVANGGLWPDVL